MISLQLTMKRAEGRNELMQNRRSEKDDKTSEKKIRQLEKKT